MNKKITILILLLLYVVMPVLMGYIIAKSFVDHNGPVLLIIFITLIVSELVVTILRVIKCKRDRE